MKRFLCALPLIAAFVLAGLDGCADREEARWNRLTKGFMSCIPDTMPEPRRQEIEGLLETFFTRANMGLVYDEDVARVESKLMMYIDGGWIDPDTLVHFMALVGYSTYRKDPRYNLPERIVDHPTLNPDAAVVFFGRDSTGPRARIYYRVPDPDSTADTTGTDTTKAPPK